MPPTTATLSAAITDAIRPPTSTAAQLITVTSRIDPLATRGIVQGCAWSAPPLTMFRKIAKPAARPAMPPVLATKNRVHP
jgi:hypothetical protein